MNTTDRLLMWLAWQLPRRLVFWCAVRVVGHATSGEWGNTAVPEITAMEALRRW